MTANSSLLGEYARLDPRRLGRRIAEQKRRLGSRVCILGHHYQRDEILEHADFIGDSLKLAQMAAEQREAEFIVFCGVHFMAESAAVLARPGQKVILPNPRAGCPMADMARAADVETAIEEISAMSDDKILPIVYVNSNAEVKAAAGSLGGSCCTSSNATAVFRWALDPAGGGAKKVLMIPDQHLGRNTAAALGYGDDACAVFDPRRPDGGLERRDVARARFLLWKGHCYVHRQFTVAQVLAARRRQDGVTVMVHPECAREVVAAADLAGSTEQIIRAVSEADPDTHWAIGTESHLVNRLAKRLPDRSIVCLSPANPVCVQMRQIDPPHLLRSLEALAEGGAASMVTVTGAHVENAKIALRRMLHITSLDR